MATPSPVTPQDFQAVVPSPSADICQKIKLVFLQLPDLLAQLVDWMLDDNGNPSEEFLTAVNPFVPGDIRVSAVQSPGMGWLYCNGQAVSRTTYAALFTAIGTTFGTGDGSTTFNVPDCRNRFLLGDSATKLLAATGGLEDVTLTTAQMPAHTHQVSTKADFVDGTNSPTREILSDDDWSGGTIIKTTTSTGSSQSHSNMPPYIVFYIHIKV